MPAQRGRHWTAQFSLPLRQSGLQLPSLASSVYGEHKTGGHLKKNKINQTLNLNCADINHSCNRLHLFIAFVHSARNLLDAPHRIHRLKNKNLYETQALCPKCSTFLLKPLFIFRGNILAPFPPSSSSSFSPLKFLPSHRDAFCAPALVAHSPSDFSSSPSPVEQAGSSSPSPEETWQQPHEQQSTGEEKMTSYLLLGPKRDDKSSLRKNLSGAVFQRLRVTSR